MSAVVAIPRFNYLLSENFDPLLPLYSVALKYLFIAARSKDVVIQVEQVAVTAVQYRFVAGIASI
jgi:hypothetical protein